MLFPLLPAEGALGSPADTETKKLKQQCVSVSNYDSNHDDVSQEEDSGSNAASFGFFSPQLGRRRQPVRHIHHHLHPH